MFFDAHLEGAEAIADPEGSVYESFAVQRGGWREMFGLRAWQRGLRAVTRGHFINRKIGDPWTPADDRRRPSRRSRLGASRHPCRRPSRRCVHPEPDRRSVMTLPIVAVHGNGGGASRYALVAPKMTGDVDFRAVTLPGFSTVPKDPALRTLSDYADRLAELCEDVERPVLLGHGIGGSMALDLASRRPEILGGLILHAPVGASLDTRLFPRVMGTRPARAFVRRAISARPLRPLLRRVFFPHGAPKTTLDTFFDEYRHCQAFGDMFDLIDRPWFDSVAPVTDLPAVLLWGEQDRVLRSGQADEIHAKVPAAEVVVRPGWDHFPMIEQPEEYASEVVAIARRLVSTG